MQHRILGRTGLSVSPLGFGGSEIGHRGAAIHESTRDRAAVVVAVFDRRQHEVRHVTRSSRLKTMPPLHDVPSIIERRGGGRLHVDLLPGDLSDVGDVEQPGRGIERDAPGITETQRPDLGP